MIKKMIRKAFFENEWKCAYRVKIDDFKSNRNKFTILSIPKGYWAADPFLVKHNESIHMFFEYMDMKKRKAIIAEKKIFPIEEDEVHVVYEFPYHTSYPCIFSVNGEHYMVPETRANHSIELLICKKWPDKWERVGSLLTGIDSADNTPLIICEKTQIFIYKFLDNGNRQLLLGTIDLDKCSIDNINVLKEYNVNTGRPGGNILTKPDNTRIRVVQPDNNFYGEKIEFLNFSIDDKNYIEIKEKEITVEDVLVDDHNNYAGLHTYNCIDDMECIDLLTKEHFNIFKPFKLVFQRLGIFGYNRYEQKGLMLNSENHKIAT